MQAAFYWLEDHFDARAAANQGRISGWVAGRLSILFAVMGDALSLRHMPPIFPKSR